MILDPHKQVGRGEALELAELVARLAQRAELHVVRRVRLRVREPLTASATRMSERASVRGTSSRQAALMVQRRTAVLAREDSCLLL